MKESNVKTKETRGYAPINGLISPDFDLVIRRSGCERGLACG
jgi:hypothetical protein